MSVQPLSFSDFEAANFLISNPHSDKLNSNKIGIIEGTEIGFTKACFDIPTLGINYTNPRNVILGGYDPNNQFAFLVRFDSPQSVVDYKEFIYKNIHALASEEIQAPFQFHIRGGIEGCSENIIQAITSWIDELDFPVKIVSGDGSEEKKSAPINCKSFTIEASNGAVKDSRSTIDKSSFSQTGFTKIHLGPKLDQHQSTLTRPKIIKTNDFQASYHEEYDLTKHDSQETIIAIADFVCETFGRFPTLDSKERQFLFTQSGVDMSALNKSVNLASEKQINDFKKSLKKKITQSLSDEEGIIKLVTKDDPIETLEDIAKRIFKNMDLRLLFPKHTITVIKRKDNKLSLNMLLKAQKNPLKHK